MKGRWGLVAIVFLFGLMAGIVVLAYLIAGPAGAAVTGIIIGLIGAGNIDTGAEVPRDGDPILETRERDREAGEAVKESVRELERQGDELEAVVERIEGVGDDIGNTANDLGSLADRIRRGVAEGTKPTETPEKP